MDQLYEFFEKFFNTSDWPPRWHCGKWSDFHGWLYIGSDVAIWLAYFLIPVILIWFLQRKPNVPFLPVFWLFSAFIILCGATHIIDAIIFWKPHYRISAVVKFLTAIVSFLTVFALIRDLPKALNIQTEDNDLLKKINDQEETIQQLKEEITKLKSNDY
ncbi:hypothetical protein [Tenacibaculum geojense]|uniref:Ethylene receptor 1-like N-terminal domain-containing protein n=1 Tax=Tenacibaculum geojense TaxID=915352 RepID=A0ABW3JTY1_9FLAO